MTYIGTNIHQALFSSRLIVLFDNKIDIVFQKIYFYWNNWPIFDNEYYPFKNKVRCPVERLMGIRYKDANAIYECLLATERVY